MFFCGFSPFGLDFGRPQASQKSLKNLKNRVRDGVGARFGFVMDLGCDFLEILGDLE